MKFTPGHDFAPLRSVGPGTDFIVTAGSGWAAGLPDFVTLVISGAKEDSELRAIDKVPPLPPQQLTWSSVSCGRIAKSRRTHQDASEARQLNAPRCD